MNLEDLNFDLPAGLIAQQPAAQRSASRMLHLSLGDKALSDRMFSDLPLLLAPGDVLVVNDTKVFPARLLGKTDSGAAIETFLVEEIEKDLWTVLAKPARRLGPGKKIFYDEGLSAEFIDKLPDGKVVLRYDCDGEMNDIVQKIGRTPLPPYIKRGRDAIDNDRERYQTVFADKRGAIAAPTAGLHFTPDVLEEIKRSGVEIAPVTLHVGYGTFEPVRSDDLSQHKVAAERTDLSAETAEMLNRAKSESRRIIAVGTTTTRTLESRLDQNGRFVSGLGLADLTITPGYRFRAIDGLLTNFHLPKSSLLVLVSSFAGLDLTMQAYRHAVEQKYRFYSYGDCMFIS